MRTLHEALQLTSRTEDVEFRRAFDSGSVRDWCDLVKDVVAMANSGGGILLVGLEDDGTPSVRGTDKSPSLVAATIDEKVHQHTGTHLSGVRVAKEHKGGRPVTAIEVEPGPYPIVFTRPGTYPTENQIQESSFAAGTVYFRHGAVSEPGSVEDMRRAFEREIQRRVEGWLENLRRIVEAPPGSMMSVNMPNAVAAAGEPGVAVRLVADPNAPAVPRWSPDETHPYRMKDVTSILNSKLAGKVELNGFDLLCVRRLHETDRNPTFYFKSRLGAPQYSEAFVEWLLEQHSRHPTFFADARAKFTKPRAPAPEKPVKEEQGSLSD